MTVFSVTSDAMDGANAIRDTAEAGYDRVRNNKDLSAAAMQRQMATAWVTAADAMRLAQGTAGDQTEMRRLRTLQAAFGIEDLVPSFGTRAEVGINYRDAQDRAAELDDAQDAVALLQRATEGGDELLARAIARQAWDAISTGFAGTGWQAVLTQYASTRPQRATAINDLSSLAPQRVSAVDLFGWMVPMPPELSGMQEHQVRALAAS